MMSKHAAVRWMFAVALVLLGACKRPPPESKPDDPRQPRDQERAPRQLNGVAHIRVTRVVPTDRKAGCWLETENLSPDAGAKARVVEGYARAAFLCHVNVEADVVLSTYEAMACDVCVNLCCLKCKRGDQMERCGAATELRPAGADPRALDELRTALSDSDSDARSWAVRELEKYAPFDAATQSELSALLRGKPAERHKLDAETYARASLYLARDKNRAPRERAELYVGVLTQDMLAANHLHAEAARELKQIPQEAARIAELLVDDIFALNRYTEVLPVELEVIEATLASCAPCVARLRAAIVAPPPPPGLRDRVTPTAGVAAYLLSRMSGIAPEERARFAANSILVPNDTLARSAARELTTYRAHAATLAPLLGDMLGRDGVNNRDDVVCDALTALGPRIEAATPRLVARLRSWDRDDMRGIASCAAAAASMGAKGADTMAALVELVNRRVGALNALTALCSIASALHPGRTAHDEAGLKFSCSPPRVVTYTRPARAAGDTDANVAGWNALNAAAADALHKYDHNRARDSLVKALALADDEGLSDARRTRSIADLVLATGGPAGGQEKRELLWRLWNETTGDQLAADEVVAAALGAGGRTHEQTRDLQAAEAYYARAAAMWETLHGRPANDRLSPTEDDVLSSLADTRERLGRLREAEAAFSTLLRNQRARCNCEIDGRIAVTLERELPLLRKLDPARAEAIAEPLAEWNRKQLATYEQLTH